MPQRHAFVRSMVKEELEDGYDDDYDYDDEYDDDDAGGDGGAAPAAPAPAPKKKPAPAPAPAPAAPKKKQQQPQQQQQQQGKGRQRQGQGRRGPKPQPPMSPGGKYKHSKLVEDVAAMRLGDEKEIEEVAEETLRADAEQRRAQQQAQQREASQRSGARAAEVARLVAERRASCKPTLNLVVIGHVDAGKSTTMGHLLYLLGGVSQRAMHKLEQESARIGKGSFAYAWVLDEQSEERSRGVTIDVGVTAFSTPNLDVTLLDAPGHRDFVPNMISGAAQADARGGGQTREHASLARGLGVRQLVVAVNQMDKVGWSKDRFEEVRGTLEPFLRKTGYSDVKFVPCSGLSGENLMICQEPALKSWFTGFSLLGAIDSCRPAERAIDTPLRLCIADVYKTANSAGTAVGGKIEAGSIAVGDRVVVLPANMLATVKSVARGQQSTDVACAGENVEVSLAGVDAAFVGVGSVVCDPARSCPVAMRVRARLLTLSLDAPLLPGQQCVAYAHNASSWATVTRFVAVLDAASGAVVRRNPRCIGENQAVEAELSFERPLCVELHTSLKSLGRFTLRTGGRTIAVGVVTHVL
eukprot:m51a1_g9958 putative hbs1-like protein (582) ;mRNA; f:54398-57422